MCTATTVPACGCASITNLCKYDSYKGMGGKTHDFTLREIAVSLRSTG